MTKKITSGFHFAILGAVSSWAIFMLYCSVDIIARFYENILPINYFDGQTSGIFYCLKILSSNYFPIYLSIFIVSMAILLYLTIKRSGFVDFLNDKTSDDSSQALSRYSPIYGMSVFFIFISVFLVTTLKELQKLGELTAININMNVYGYIMLVLLGIMSIGVLFVVILANKRCLKNKDGNKFFRSSILLSIFILIHPFLLLAIRGGFSISVLDRYYGNPYQIFVFMALASLFCFLLGAAIKMENTHRLKSVVIIAVLYIFTFGILFASQAERNKIVDNASASKITSLLSLERAKGDPVKLLILKKSGNPKISDILNENNNTFYTDENRIKINEFLQGGAGTDEQKKQAYGFIMLSDLRNGDTSKILKALMEETEKRHKDYNGGLWQYTIYATKSLSDILLNNLYDESFKVYADYITDPNIFATSNYKNNAKLRVIAEKYGLMDRAQYYKNMADSYKKHKLEYDSEYQRLKEMASIQSDGVIKGRVTYGEKRAHGIKVGLLLLKNRFGTGIDSEAKIYMEWLEDLYKERNSDYFLYVHQLRTLNNSKTVVTDENGDFIFKNIDKGNYLLYLILENGDAKLDTNTEVGLIKSEGNKIEIPSIVLE